MSVDPFIQMPQSSQSINPYSCIMNNPMAGTDPTGYLAQGNNASNWRDTCLDPHGCLSTLAERALSAYTSSGGNNNSLSLNAQKGLDEMNKGFAAVEQAWNVFANTFGQVDIVDLPNSEHPPEVAGMVIITSLNDKYVVHHKIDYDSASFHRARHSIDKISPIPVYVYANKGKGNLHKFVQGQENEVYE